MTQLPPIPARRVRVTAIRDAAEGIKVFDLEPADGRPLSPFEAGAHIDVHVPNGPMRQYSICSDPAKPSSYSIAVKREPESRGGSAAMHDTIDVGSIMGIGGPRNFFPLADDARRHVFIAGGIGITPIMAMIRRVSALGGKWVLHYCARGREFAAFYDELKAAAPGNVIAYFSEAPLLDTAELLKTFEDGDHLYCCGPEPLMQAVERNSRHWPQGHVHFEWFSNPDAGAPAGSAPDRMFEVELRRSGRVLTVPANRSILAVLRDAGIPAQSGCEEGVCGVCETSVVEGQPDHRDRILSDEEKAAGKTMLICVSRARGERLVLDI